MASSFPGSIDSFTNPLAASALNSPSHAGQHQDLNDAVNKVETYMGLVKVIPTAATNGTIGATGSVTIGNAVSSVTITAFSSLYENYRIVMTNFSMSTGASIRAQLRTGGTTSTANYAWAGVYLAYTATTVNGEAASADSSWNVGYSQGSANSLIFDVAMPFLAVNTRMTVTNGNEGYMGVKGGYHNVATSYSDIVLTTAAGTMTGGTIRVYGYRN